MTNGEMLKELIELAIKNDFGISSKYEDIIKTCSITWLLFNHDFAKSIFGECSLNELEADYCGVGNCHCADGWQYHLQQLATTLEKDRIKYAYENRNK